MDTKGSGRPPIGEGSATSPTGERLSLVAICLESDAGAELRQFVRGTPFLRLQAEVHSYLTEDDIALSWMQGPGPDICLIDFDKDRPSAITTAERIHEKLPNAAIFAISSNSQPNLIIEAMRCGCTEYVVKPADRDQLLEAVARVGGRKKEKREQLAGQVLVFLGAKGGSGVTTLSTHLASLLAKSLSRRVVLIDLHPTCGEASLFLGVTKHPYHFYELAENVERLDGDLLQSYVVHHPSGLDLLPAPDFRESERRVLAESVGQAIDFIRTRYEFVVVDCAPGLNDQNVEVIRRADHLYLVTVPEVPALRNVARLLDYLDHHDLPQYKVDVVVNRHQSKNSMISDGETEKAIRRKIFWKVPNSYQKVIRAINSGDPTADFSDSDVARSLIPWAESLGAKPSSLGEKKKSGKSFLGIFGR
jgi:pilus assembly protein CpaE